MEESDFTHSGGNGPLIINGVGPDGTPILGKFNNTVVIKKGQLSQGLRNSLVLQPGVSIGINNSGAPNGSNSIANQNSSHVRYFYYFIASKLDCTFINQAYSIL